MKKVLCSNHWSLRRCIGRSAQFLVVLLALTVTANAQDKKQQTVDIHKTLHKRSISNILPRPNFPMATPEEMRRAKANEEPLNFTDRVWFPGEWEEVKAVVVTLAYNHMMPKKAEDKRYGAYPVIPGYAIYYYQEASGAPLEEVGRGPYITTLDVITKDGLVNLRLIDGIQRAGAEAWVRIEDASDEALVRKVMEAYDLRTDKIKFIVSKGNSVWFRDCGPICFYYGDEDKVGMLDFEYGWTRQLDDQLPSVLHRKMGIPNYINKVIWEGGNCLVDGVGGLMTSSAIYSNNLDTIGPIDWDKKDVSTIKYTTRKALQADEVYEALRGMVGQRETSVVTQLKNDGGTGHVDLYADAIDENGLLFTKIPEYYSEWKDYKTMDSNIKFMLKEKNFWDTPYIAWGDIPFPAKDDGSDFEDEDDYGLVARTYANHLIVNNYILQPCFSIVGEDGMPTADWDRENIEAMKKLYPGYTFQCIDMRSFDGSGGSIHCITKQIPADNPVRILHEALYNQVNFGTMTEVPFNAFITNKSGIQKASLHYQVGEDGEWQKVDMTSNGNRWYCRVPVSKFPNGKKVNYYIEATSKNGKTMTKPYTASEGGYYDFTPDNTAYHNPNDYDFSTDPIAKEKITFQLDTKWLTEDKSTDDPTGISEIQANKPVELPCVWYTLDGRRLDNAPTTKGLYIFQGKKVVIK